MPLTNGNKEDGSIDVHAGQCSNDCTAAKQELTTNKDVGDEGENHEDQMGNATVSCVDDFKVGMASWRVLFDFTSQDGEDQDLHRGSCCVPERTCNSICVGNLLRVSNLHQPYS